MTVAELTKKGPRKSLVMMPELAFVLAPRQNLFFNELVGALRAEAQLLGVRTSLHIGNFPKPRRDLVYLLVPPHEYFTLMHGRFGPLPEVLKRTIFICGEQPRTPFFNANVDLAPRAGAVFDINRSAVRAFARHGITAQHLQLGWTAEWDHFSNEDRPTDVLFMGALSERRERALGSYARTLSRLTTQLILSDNSRPNWAPSESYRADAEKWDLLSHTKILLNIHQGQEPYFEWLRIVQAIAAGAVVVTEHSLDVGPLVAGKHFLSGDVKSLHLLAASLVDNPERMKEMRTAAYETLRGKLPLANAVSRLAAAAAELADSQPTPDGGHIFFTQPPPDPERMPIVSGVRQPVSVSNGDLNASWMRRALKDLRLEVMELRRHQARIELEAKLGTSLPTLEITATTAAFAAAVPRVSILTALYNHRGHISAALDSAAGSRDCAYELIVVDDGSSDGSSEAVLAWIACHQDIPLILLRHPVNRGLAHARNDALELGRGEFCFVLDADNEIYPHCLSLLSAALDRHQEAWFAYGTLERFAGSECLGLINTLPWDPERLREGNYIDAMTLMRAAAIRALGGYPTDRRLHGWEDYALWCAVANAGGCAVRVPEIVARYRVARHSMLSLTNISSTDAFSLIIETNPRLMAGVTAPD